MTNQTLQTTQAPDSLARRGTTPGALAQWDSGQLEILRRSICPGLTNDQLAHFGQVCQSLGLSPFRRQIAAVLYKRRDGGSDMSVQITMDGYAALAQRTGRFAGLTMPEYKEAAAGPWLDIWPYPPSDKRRPLACRVGVRVVGQPEPSYAVVLWHEFAKVNDFWTRMPAYMLAKTAICHGLRLVCQEEVAVAQESVLVSTGQQLRIEASPLEMQVANDPTAPERRATEHASVAQVHPVHPIRHVSPVSVAERSPRAATVAVEEPDEISTISSIEEGGGEVATELADHDLWPTEPPPRPAVSATEEAEPATAPVTLERAWQEWQEASTEALRLGIGHKAPHRATATAAELKGAATFLRRRSARAQGRTEAL